MLSLDKNEILKIQNNEPPYLMIDYATEVIPGKSSLGYKLLESSEWFFEVHWRNDPNMPGMLQLEALTQMASLSILTLPGNKKKFLYLTSIKNAEFKKKILPNTKLEIFTKVISFKRGLANFDGEGRIEGKIACRAQFQLILPDAVLSPKKIA